MNEQILALDKSITEAEKLEFVCIHAQDLASATHLRCTIMDMNARRVELAQRATTINNIGAMLPSLIQIVTSAMASQNSHPPASPAESTDSE